MPNTPDAARAVTRDWCQRIIDQHGGHYDEVLDDGTIHRVSLDAFHAHGLLAGSTLAIEFAQLPYRVVLALEAPVT